MRSVYLLKDYQDKNKGDVIVVSNNIAFGLIDKGTARNAKNKDFLVKPEFGSSKSFKRPPSKAFVKRSKGGILKQ